MRYLKECVLAAALSLTAPAMADNSFQPLIDVNYKPDPSTDEGGFWYQVDKMEASVSGSPYTITDPELNKYLSGLVCKLSGEYCSSIRVYLIDNPHFNASMYPNGMMHVWSGLLLRVENEAQLAAILGHEIAHYLRTHQLQQWRNLQDKAVAGLLLDIGLAALTGVGGLGSLAMTGSVAAFGRDMEREADFMGVEMMFEAGYDPMEASKLWQSVIEEREKDQSKDSVSIFWASHPPSVERNQYLKAIAEKRYGSDDSGFGYDADSGQFKKLMSQHYFALMKNHVALQEFEQTEVLLERHKTLGYPDASIAYFYGELFRKRAAPGDREKAIEHYQLAVSEKEHPADAHKQLGYLFVKLKDNAKAKTHFDQYLKLAPDAKDKAMIQYYLKALG